MNLGETDDLVISAITNYNWDHVKYYVNSLNKSGFKGKKAMILYNVSKDLANRLIDNDFTIFAWDRDTEGNFEYKVPGFNICVERFAHLWYFINKIETPIRYVITTDVRDVIFQNNPSTFLDQALKSVWWAAPKANTYKYKIIASSENMFYKDEPWSSNNIKQAFGDYQYEQMKDKEIYCAGVIAGERQYFVDLCLQIFLTSRGSKPFTTGGGGPDQAAYNITLNMKPWKDITYFSNSDETWACQAGTTKTALVSGSGDIGVRFQAGDHELMSKFIHGQALMNTNERITNNNLDVYSIVHQWDRIDQWKKAITDKYAL